MRSNTSGPCRTASTMQQRVHAGEPFHRIIASARTALHRVRRYQRSGDVNTHRADHRDRATLFNGRGATVSRVDGG